MRHHCYFLECGSENGGGIKMDKYYIPQHLDAPFRIALLTMDELLVFFVPFIVLFWVDAMLIGVTIGACLVIALKKIKGEEGQAYLSQLIYWYLPTIYIHKVTPPSYIRYWIG